MQKTLLFLPALCLAALLAAQQPVSIEGRALNWSGNIVIREYGMPFSNNALQVSPDVDGRYKAQWNIYEPTFVRFEHGRQATLMYVRPGDRLQADFDGQNLMQSISFADSLNSFLKEYQRYQRMHEAANKMLYALPHGAFEQQVDAQRQQMNELLAKAALRDPLFVDLVQAETDFQWATHRLLYVPYHAQQTGQNAQTLNGQISKDWLKGLNLNDNRFILSKTYRDFLYQYIVLRTDEMAFVEPRIKSSNAMFTLYQYASIGDVTTNPMVAQYAKTRILYEYVSKYGITGVENALSDFFQSVEQPIFRGFMEQLYEQWKHLNYGAPAPEFTMHDIAGNPVRLADFKGKYVYIDVWATWCGPCRREWPFLEKLQKDFEGQDVVFLSVSIDRDKKAWENMVAEQQMKGVQVFSPGGWGADVNTKYNITSIPRFMLIAPDGSIYNINVARPSGGIDGVLRQLLN